MQLPEPSDVLAHQGVTGLELLRWILAPRGRLLALLPPAPPSAEDERLTRLLDRQYLLWQPTPYPRVASPGLLRETHSISMDSRGRYLDNIFIEPLCWSLKYECVQTPRVCRCSLPSPRYHRPVQLLQRQAWSQRSCCSHSQLCILLRASQGGMNTHPPFQTTSRRRPVQGMGCSALQVPTAIARSVLLDPRSPELRDFFHWYNQEHRHSGIGLVTRT
jgi:hypothetical protein